MYGSNVLPNTGLAGAAGGSAGIATSSVWFALGIFALLMLVISLVRAVGTFRSAE